MCHWVSNWWMERFINDEIIDRIEHFCLEFQHATYDYSKQSAAY